MKHTHWILGSLTALSFSLGAREARWNSLPDDVQSLLDAIEFVDLPDGTGGTARTLRVVNWNVQVVNGLGATNGSPADPQSFAPGVSATNGLGNVYVGYAEAVPGTQRTGSHGLGLGHGAGWTGFAGIVGGRSASAAKAYAQAVGGSGVDALGDHAVALGGLSTAALGSGAAVLGGFRGQANGSHATAVGGGSQSNGVGITVGGELATGGGGRGTSVSGRAALVIGGGAGTSAASDDALVIGGEGDVADDVAAAVLGGADRTSSAVLEVIADGQGADDDWQRVEQAGLELLVAQAARVSVGQVSMAAALSVDGDAAGIASELVGDLRIGGGASESAGPAEELAFRAENGRWSLGARNDASSALFVAGADANEPELALSAAGDLGLGGVSDPASPLHLRSPRATFAIECTGLGTAGLALKVGTQSLGELVLDRMLELSAGLYLDGVRAALLVVGEQQGIRIAPALRVTGLLNATKSIAVQAAVDVGAALVVGEDAEVAGDLRVAGGLDAELPIAPFAWGHFGPEGVIDDGSGNWNLQSMNEWSARIRISDLPTASTDILLGQVTSTAGFTSTIFVSTRGDDNNLGGGEDDLYIEWSLPKPKLAPDLWLPSIQFVVFRFRAD